MYSHQAFRMPSLNEYTCQPTSLSVRWWLAFFGLHSGKEVMSIERIRSRQGRSALR
jgi:hypothetical protein